MDTALIAPYALGFLSLLASTVTALAIGIRLWDERESRNHLLGLVLGVGLLLIARLLSAILYLFPHQPIQFYTATIGILSCFPLVFLRREIIVLTSACKDWITSIRLRWNISALNWALTALVLFLITIYGLAAGISPLAEGDPTHYALCAKSMYLERSTEFYPFGKSQSQTGYSNPSAHPLGFPALAAWGHMLQGNDQYNGIIKLIGWGFSCCSCLLLYSYLRPYGHRSACAGALLFLGTPAYFRSVSGFAVEPMRLYAMLLALFWCIEAGRQQDKKFVWVAGVVLGLSMHTHSLNGMFTIPMGFAGYWLTNTDRLRTRLIMCGVLSIIALAVGGGRYWTNLWDSGSPIIGIDHVIRNLPELRYEEYRTLQKGWDGWWERLLNGTLAGFTKPQWMGLSFWLCLPAIIIWLINIKAWRTSPILSATISALGLYLIATVIPALIRGNPNLLSSRYLLTLLPLSSFVGGIILGKLLEGRWKIASLWARKSVVLPSKILGMVCIAMVVYIFIDGGQPALMWKRYGNWENFSRSSWQIKLGKKDPFFTALNYIRHHTKAESRFLVFVNGRSFAYYSARRMIDHLDPAMAEVYKMIDPHDTYRALQEMGIDYVLLGYTMPETFTNTSITDVLGNPEWSSLVVQWPKLKLFSLNQIQQNIFTESLETIGPKAKGQVQWRETLILEHSQPESQYRLGLEAKGRGWLWITVQGVDNAGKRRKFIVWNGIMWPEKFRHFYVQFEKPKESKKLEITLQFQIPDQVVIANTSLERIRR